MGLLGGLVRPDETRKPKNQQNVLQTVKAFIRRQNMATSKKSSQARNNEEEQQASQTDFSGEATLKKGGKGPVEPLDAKHMGDLLSVAAGLKNNVPG